MVYSLHVLQLQKVGARCPYGTGRYSVANRKHCRSCTGYINRDKNGGSHIDLLLTCDVYKHAQPIQGVEGEETGGNCAALGRTCIPACFASAVQVSSDRSLRNECCTMSDSTRFRNTYRVQTVITCLPHALTVLHTLQRTFSVAANERRPVHQSQPQPSKTGRCSKSCGSTMTTFAVSRMNL